MTFKVQRGSFAKSTAGAPVSQEIDTGSGLEIKYIHFWTEQQVGTGFSVEDQGHSEGWSDGTDEVCVGGASEHDASPPVSGRRMAEVALSCIDPSGTLRYEGTITSFGTAGDAGKFTINWTTNNAVASQIYYEAYCGDSILNVAIGTRQTPQVTGNEAITGIGFQPNYLVYCSISRDNNLPTTQNDNSVSVGSAISSSKRNTVAYYMDDNGADTISTQTDLLLRTLAFGGMGGPAQVQDDIDFVSFDADGWTTNMVVADDDVWVGYVAVEFDSLVEIDIGVFNQPTTTGAVNTSTSNKNNHAVLFRSQNRTTTGTIINDGHVRITTGIGVLESHDSPEDEHVTGFDYDDSVDPTDSENMGVTNKAIKFFEQLSTVQAEADLIDPTVVTDFRLDWTTADATARAVLYTAFSFEFELRELTHTTDSVLLGKILVTHTTDSTLKKLDTEITHTTDSTLRKIDNELTHTTDSYLLAIRELTHTTDSTLKALDQTVTHTTDSTLRKIDNELTHTTDSILLAIQTLTHTTDSYLEAIRRHTTDSTLKLLNILVTHTTNSVFEKLDNLVTHTTDSVLGETEPGLTVSHTTDSTLKALDQLVTHTTDSVLGETEPGFTKTHTTDSLLKKLDTELTHTTDSVLRKIDIEIAIATDSVLKAILTRTHTTDSVLGETEPGLTVIHTTDSTLKKLDTELTHTTDSVCAALRTRTHTTDSILLTIQTLTHTTDSVLGETEPGFTKTHTTDSILKALDQTLTHTTDSVLGETEPGISIVHTTDSLLKIPFSVFHTTDSNLISQQCHLLTEAGGYLLQEDGGRLLLEKCTHILTHTTDSTVGPVNDKTHTTDSLIRERFQEENVYANYDDTPEISIYLNDTEEISVLG